VLGASRFFPSTVARLDVELELARPENVASLPARYTTLAACAHTALALCPKARHLLLLPP
jgi:hypothetical protein